MHLAHLSLTNFRNYARLEIDFPPGVTVLRGDNAQGKTNLLEALHVLATTKSPRAGNERELMNWAAMEDSLPGARIASDIVRADGMTRLEISLFLRSSDGQGDGTGAMKRYRVNGVVRRAADVVGHLPMVLFSPQDIELVSGAPAVRRRYLDIANAQIEHRYVRALQHYQRVLLQRNHLLRAIRDGRASTSQLEFWDDQIVEHGSFILSRRLQFIAAVNERTSRVHAELVGRPERLLLSYDSSARDVTAEEGLPRSLDELRELLVRRMSAGRDREVSAGASLFGPHRDDLRFSVDGVDSHTFGSRGQQRTVALALKLSEADVLWAVSGERPLLLLDDVMSELDAHRRQHLLASIQPDQQVILTCTDFAVFSERFLERSHRLSVTEGRILEGAEVLN